MDMGERGDRNEGHCLGNESHSDIETRQAGDGMTGKRVRALLWRFLKATVTVAKNMFPRQTRE